MGRFILPVFFVGLAMVAAQLLQMNGAHATSMREPRMPSDPIALYGDDMQFDVLRDGRKAGWHRVHFQQKGSILTVDSTFHLQIEMLFLTLFRYRYHATGEWQDGQLNHLTVAVDDDGQLFDLTVERRGSRLTVTSDRGTYSVGMPLYPTNHWNADVLGASHVLNTLTGRINHVEIEPAGREAVETERGPVMATRYAFSGELETEVWYDDQGRWVKMRFEGRDGSTVEYACRRCQGGAEIEAQR